MNRPNPIVANAANVNLTEASKHLIGVLQGLNDINLVIEYQTDLLEQILSALKD